MGLSDVPSLLLPLSKLKPIAAQAPLQAGFLCLDCRAMLVHVARPAADCRRPASFAATGRRWRPGSADLFQSSLQSAVAGRWVHQISCRRRTAALARSSLDAPAGRFRAGFQGWPSQINMATGVTGRSVLLSSSTRNTTPPPAASPKLSFPAGR